MSDRIFDVAVVGGGTCGVAIAIFAAERGAHVIIIEAADKLGGSLNVSSGQLSAAGTELQESQGIIDSADAHFDDVIRISKGTVARDLVRLAVDNAADTVNWLQQKGLEFLPGHPVIGEAHEPYSAPRYYWAERNGLSIADVLLAELDKWVHCGKVEVLLEAAASQLVFDEETKGVTGVTYSLTSGTPVSLNARNVVLTTGGYNSNAALYRELTGHPSYAGMSYPSNQGAGISMALQAGGWLRGRDNFLTSFGNVLEREDELASLYARATHQPEVRMPWEIYVNEEGLRFIAEDEPSVDAREHALLRQPYQRRYIIFDQEILEKAPPVIEGWSTEQIQQHFGEHPMFKRGDSVQELAERAGLPPENLQETISTFNSNLEGQDEFGRQFRPRPIQRAPFYAIRAQGTSVTSTVGVAVNEDLQVIDPEGLAVNGLYASGEVLGSGQLMGKAFCGGMMATPAMTFGRLLGRDILQW